MKFTDQMQAALDTDFKKLGNVLKKAGESQASSAANAAEMVEAVTALVEVNKEDTIYRRVKRYLHTGKQRAHIIGDREDIVPAERRLL